MVARETRSLPRRSELGAYLADELGRSIEAVQKQIVALGFRGRKSAIGQGQERNVRAGLANFACQV